MFAMSLTRRDSRLRAYVAIVIVAVLARRVATMPLDARHPGDAEETRDKSEEDVATKEFSMQAWLLFDPRTNRWPPQDTPQIIRRITPKSVFIAPVLPACAEGYQEDTMHRCMKKTVAINTTFHLPFLLKRLEQMYNKRNGDTGTAGALSNHDKQSTGPLQLNIPLVSGYYDSPQATKDEEHVETGGSMEVPVVVPPDDEPRDEPTKKRDQVLQITVYEVQNDTNAVPDAEENRDEKLHEEYHFFPDDASTRRSEKDRQVLAGEPDAVVRVAEHVNEANETQVTATTTDYAALETTTVDYETQDTATIDYETQDDATLDYDIQESATVDYEMQDEPRTSTITPTSPTTLPDDESESNVTDPTPTVYLLLSNQTDGASTKLPTLIPVTEVDDIRVVRNHTTTQLIIRISNITASLIDKDEDDEDVEVNSSTPVASLPEDEPETLYDDFQDESKPSAANFNASDGAWGTQDILYEEKVAYTTNEDVTRRREATDTGTNNARDDLPSSLSPAQNLFFVNAQTTARHD